MRRLIQASLFLAAVAAVTGLSTAQVAQPSDVVVMRVPVAAHAKNYGHVDTPVYDGTWIVQTSNGACSGGTQTITTIVSCSGESCDPATKPDDSPRQDQCGTCGTLMAYQYPKGGSTKQLSTSVPDLASAQAVCDAYAANSTTPGICGHSETNHQVWWYYGTATMVAQTSPRLYAAACKAGK